LDFLSILKLSNEVIDLVSEGWELDVFLHEKLLDHLMNVILLQVSSFDRIQWVSKLMRDGGVE
jgi:hypothetical protein